MNRAISTICAALTAAVIAAAPAYAFKLEGGDTANSSSQGFKANETSPFYGPKKFDFDTKDVGNGVYKFGNTEMRVGTPSTPEADFRAGVERMFNPLGRPGN